MKIMRKYNEKYVIGRSLCQFDSNLQLLTLKMLKSSPIKKDI